MNPVVKIENNKYDSFLIYPNDSEEKTMVVKTLFDAKYDSLKDTFIIENDDKVYDFIKDHENIFNLLEEVKPSLSKYFHDEKYYLQVRCYPEIYEKELALIIEVDYSKKDMHKLTKQLMNVDLEINDYQIELGLIGKFFITLEGL